MIPSFGWSTAGAEQNDPDTVNNLLFGHIEATPAFSDVFADQLDDSSSFGLLGSSKSDDGLLFPMESPLQKNESLQLPTNDCICGFVPSFSSLLSQRVSAGGYETRDR